MEFSSAIYRGDPCPEFSFSFKCFVFDRMPAAKASVQR